MPNWKALETLPTFVPRRIRPLGQPILRLRVAGTSREIGRQRGQELGEDMRRFQEWLEYYLLHVLEVPADRWDRIAERLERHLARMAPWMLEETHGMAATSGVAVNRLLLGNFLGLVADADAHGCTSLAVRRSDAGPLLGQNLDIGPEDFHYIEEWRPAGGLAVLRNVKITMCRSECGLNSAGLAVASSNLPATAQAAAPWDWDGTYFHFLPILVLRACATVAEAIDFLRELPPTIPSSAGYQLNLLDPTGAMAVVDKTGRQTVVRQCEPDLNLTTNCTFDENFERWRLGGPYPDGVARADRIRQAWAKLQGAVPTHQWMVDLLRTDTGAGCLCRWSQVGYSRLSFIFAPARRTMVASNGPPARVPYEDFSLSPLCEGLPTPHSG